MNFVSRMTTGRGNVIRSDRTTRSVSASTISAFPSITKRSARRMGTMVSGSNDAFKARHPIITHPSYRRYESSRHTRAGGGYDDSPNGDLFFSYRLQPPIRVRYSSFRYAQILLLNPPRHRPTPPLADRHMVDRSDRRHLRRGPAEKHLVSDIQHLARNRLLAHLMPHVAGDLHDRVPRHTGQDRARDGRRVHHVVPHDEDVLPAALGDVAERVEHDALDESALPRLDQRELRVQVVPARLGHRRKRVGRGPPPTRHADATPFSSASSPRYRP